MDERMQQLTEWNKTVTSWLINKDSMSEELKNYLNIIAMSWYNATIERSNVDLMKIAHVHVDGYNEMEDIEAIITNENRERKNIQKFIESFITAKNDVQFNMLFSIEREKFPSDLAKVTNKSFIANDNYQIIIDYLFATVLDAKEQEELINTLCTSAALIALEQLLIPFLGGKNNLVYTKLTSKNEYFVRPIRGKYKMSSVRYKKDERSDAVFNRICYSLNVPLEIRQKIERRLEYIPVDVYPFAIFSLYNQYMQAIDKGEKDIAVKSWGENLKIIPDDNANKRFKLIKEDSTLNMHYAFLSSLENISFEYNLNMYLNLYLYGQYFPLDDVFNLYELCADHCTSGKEFNRYYKYQLECVNVKPYFTKRFLLDNSKKFRFKTQDELCIKNEDKYLSGVDILNAIADCLAFKMLNIANEYKNREGGKLRYVTEESRQNYKTYIGKKHTPTKIDIKYRKYEYLYTEFHDFFVKMHKSSEDKILNDLPKLKKEFENFIRDDINKYPYLKDISTTLVYNDKAGRSFKAMIETQNKNLSKKNKKQYLDESEVFRTIYQSVRKSRDQFNKSHKK